MDTGEDIFGSAANSSMRYPGAIVKVFSASFGAYGGPERLPQAEQRRRKETMTIAFMVAPPYNAGPPAV